MKFDAAFASRLPQNGTPLVVSALLMELALEASRLSGRPGMSEPSQLIAAVIAHQVRLPVLPPGLFVPDRRDKRLRPAIGMLRDRPGMTFGHWRERLRIVCAVDRLTRGLSITRTALELGYQSSSSFTTLLTRQLGAPLRRYMRRWTNPVPLKKQG